MHKYYVEKINNASKKIDDINLSFGKSSYMKYTQVLEIAEVLGKMSDRIFNLTKKRPKEEVVNLKFKIDRKMIKNMERMGISKLDISRIYESSKWREYTSLVDNVIRDVNDILYQGNGYREILEIGYVLEVLDEKIANETRGINNLKEREYVRNELSQYVRKEVENCVNSPTDMARILENLKLKKYNPIIFWAVGDIQSILLEDKNKGLSYNQIADIVDVITEADQRVSNLLTISDTKERKEIRSKVRSLIEKEIVHMGISFDRNISSIDMRRINNNVPYQEYMSIICGVVDRIEDILPQEKNTFRLPKKEISEIAEVLCEARQEIYSNDLFLDKKEEERKNIVDDLSQLIYDEMKYLKINLSNISNIKSQLRDHITQKEIETLIRKKEREIIEIIDEEPLKEIKVPPSNSVELRSKITSIFKIPLLVYKPLQPEIKRNSIRKQSNFI